MRLAIIILLLSFGFHANAQEKNDSIADKNLAQDTVVQDTAHSFKKAMIYSAILPGAGQIYNHIAMPKGQKKAYWKVPIIYAGLGATGYYAFSNNKTKNDLRTEYEYRKSTSFTSVNNFPEYDEEGLLQLYSTYRTRRDLCIVGIAVVYMLNVLDAGVEAHFVNFDVSNDLSLSILPKFDFNSGYGVALTLNFR